MRITVLYVGASLPGPLKEAERVIRSKNKIDLDIALHNCGDSISDRDWPAVEQDINASEVVFIIHVTNQENATRIISALQPNPRDSRIPPVATGGSFNSSLEKPDRADSGIPPVATGGSFNSSLKNLRIPHPATPLAGPPLGPQAAGQAPPTPYSGLETPDCPTNPRPTVIAINCMPELIRLTHMGKLDFGELMKRSEADSPEAHSLVRKLGSWMADSVRRRKAYDPSNGRKHAGFQQYTGLINRMPAILRFLPTAGKLTDIKHYIYLFCYFLQPTPANIRSMILYAIKHYVPGYRRLRIPLPESLPSTGIYHPDAPKLFDSYDSYKKWYEKARGMSLDRHRTVGLLLMRPQIIGGSRGHYDRLIRAIEQEGLAVLPILSTFMDNRQASREYFADPSHVGQASSLSSPDTTASIQPGATGRVSQIISLTGFSFVGGPAMNDSHAAVEFLSDLNVPLRSMVSLDIQTIETWESSRLGLNPVQTAMQIAIPEIDGATEPFIYGGMPQAGFRPEPIEDRCRRIARRLARWNRLQTLPRSELKLALVVFCFPPNKGNIGTAAELDVFPSLLQILRRLTDEGYNVEVPSTADLLREMMLGGRGSGVSGQGPGAGVKGTVGSTAAFCPTAVAYRMSVQEYNRLCPYAREIEREWGPAPGRLNSDGQNILIQGITLGNVFIGVQPTFGYEGDPMRMLAAEGGSPHHGFMGFYTYIEKVFQADAAVHVGTHGALEFMPGKQAGLSSSCWPDRLIGELPNIYIYSVNNPSEGTIAKRRSYGELISYLTPPMDNAGLYKGLASLKEMILAYRQSTNESDREQFYKTIEEQAKSLNFHLP